MWLVIFYVFCGIFFLPVVSMAFVGIPIGLFADDRWKYSCPLIAFSLGVYYVTTSVLWGLLTFVGVPFLIVYLLFLMVMIAM
jgi:hypothetical protein